MSPEVVHPRSSPADLAADMRLTFPLGIVGDFALSARLIDRQIDLPDKPRDPGLLDEDSDLWRLTRSIVQSWPIELVGRALANYRCRCEEFQGLVFKLFVHHGEELVLRDLANLFELASNRLGEKELREAYLQVIKDLHFNITDPFSDVEAKFRADLEKTPPDRLRLFMYALAEKQFIRPPWQQPELDLQIAYRLCDAMYKEIELCCSPEA